MRRLVLGVALWIAATPAFAGPPFITDDAEPTTVGTWEVNLFNAGTTATGSGFEQAGVSASYGWSDDW